MKYQLKISINTDGDFYFPYVPCGMTCDGEKYHFQKEYRDRETAIRATHDICQFLKKHLTTSKDYVKKEIENFISVFETRLENSEESDNEYVSDYAKRILENSAAMHDCTVEIKLMGAAQSLVSDEDFCERIALPSSRRMLMAIPESFMSTPRKYLSSQSLMHVGVRPLLSDTVPSPREENS